MESEEYEDESPDNLALGKAIGEYEAYREAQRAYDMGEIELWLAFYKPKTIAEWVEWELEHGRSGDFEKRWAR